MMTDEYDYAQHERSAECTLEGIVALEVRIKCVHVVPALLVKGQPNRIDTDRWKPIIMSFCRYYGLGSELAVSKLAQIPEEQYRTPDIDRANVERLRNANRDRAAAD
jgi:hypothetical protein